MPTVSFSIFFWYVLKIYIMVCEFNQSQVDKWPHWTCLTRCLLTVPVVFLPSSYKSIFLNFIGSFFYYLCFSKRFNLWLRWFLKYVVFINLRRELIIIIIASIFDTHLNARKGPCIAFILRIFGSHYHNNSNPWKINWYDRSDEILEEKFTYKFLFKSALLDSFSAYFFVLNSGYICHGPWVFPISDKTIINYWKVVKTGQLSLWRYPWPIS